MGKTGKFVALLRLSDSLELKIEEMFKFMKSSMNCCDVKYECRNLVRDSKRHWN